MQKKIIALAVAAAFSAPAFADTTVYGIVDAAIANTSATGNKSNLNVISGGLSTSRLGVVASEDLGGGMKAIAAVEYKLDVSSNAAVGVSANAAGAATISARKQMLAIAGDFGTVAAGYLQTAGYDFAGKFDPAAGSAVDAYANVKAPTNNLINTGARAPHAAAYISPNMGGVTVAYNRTFNFFSTGAVASNATTGTWTTGNLLSVTYEAGPLAVGGVYAGATDDNATATKYTEMGLGASYDLGAAKLFGTYQTSKVDTGGGASSDKEMSFSAVAPVGPGALLAQVAKTTIDSDTTVGGKTGLTVAYLHSMSKMTTLYGAVTQIKQDAGVGTGANVSNTTTILAVGVRKKF